MALPQFWLADDVRRGLERLARRALDRGVGFAIHTHVNAAAQVTPLVAAATKAALEVGVRDVRNQGVLLRGVNATAEAILDLCFALLDGASISPYYFYVCDMIPASEHWRIAVWEAQELQEQTIGYLPGFATPRIVCDVPYVGKRWVHQVAEYDRVLGISYWTKNYWTPIEDPHAQPLQERWPYYDPIRTLPPAGQEWWRAHEAEQGALQARAERMPA
jgi:lysine 2,3-aminomutase